MKPYAIGVDLGGTKMLAGAVDADGRVLAQEKKATRAERGPQDVVQRVIACVEAVRAATPGQPAAIGIGCPGTLDLAAGTVIFSPNLPGWENFPLGRLLSARFGLPVALGNDVNVAALGEYAHGAGRRLAGGGLLAAIFVGTGIGGGLVLNGEVWEGLRGVAGEIGHTVIEAYSQQVCGCGSKGCLEALASRTAVERRIRARLKKGERSVIKSEVKKDRPIKSGVLAEAFRQQDNMVRQELLQACRALGLGVANLINLLDPHLVVLGGGLMEALGDQLLPVIRKTADAHVLPHSHTYAPLVVAELGGLAGVVGAAELARRKLGARVTG